jgi:hypothetical protein
MIIIKEGGTILVTSPIHYCILEHHPTSQNIVHRYEKQQHATFA